MPTATPVAEPSFYAGPARTFLLDPQIRDPSSGRMHQHVTVFKMTQGGPRVEIVGAKPDGTAVVMNPLPGSFILQHDVSLEDACTWSLMTAGGYEITAPAPEPEPEPEAPEGEAA